MRHAEALEIESEPPESQSVDSIYETAPEHKSEISEEEDPLPLEFLRSIKPDVFEDFGNTSRYFCQKRCDTLGVHTIGLHLFYASCA